MRRATPLLLLSLTLALALALAGPLCAHDIPNARVDRSIQATVRPGRLEVDYEVSLSELTLTQDLRNLIGALPGADRQTWYDRYGRETAPLNAKGFLVTVDGNPVDLRTRDRAFDLMVEEHPRYTFHFEAEIPVRGRLALQDTNFVASEGTSRLALRGESGVAVRGDPLPGDVRLIPIRPVWQLSDAEEQRTRQVLVEYQPETPSAVNSKSEPAPQTSPGPPPRPVPSSRLAGSERLSRLLDRSSGLSLLGLLLLAFGLGAAHAVQPGHGKTLVAATVVADRGNWLRGVVLALAATATHTGSVLLVAAGLWLTRSTRYGAIHAGLSQGAGFAIAAIGFWRLGRHLAGLGEHDGEEPTPAGAGRRSAVALGVAGGLVPCWDAVALIVLAEAVGRLGLGVVLLLAFGLGMAAVLVVVGWSAARLRRLIVPAGGDRRAERWLGVAGSVVLAGMGLVLMVAS